MAFNEIKTPGAEEVQYYFRNMQYSDLLSDMPLLSLGLANNLARLVYKTGNTPFKIMVDASGATNLVDDRVMITSDSGKANVSTVTSAELELSITNNHTHGNKSILDATDATYTTAKDEKLAGLDGSKFLGAFPSLIALTTDHPTAPLGSFAYVDFGVGADISLYLWDHSDTAWVLGGGTGTETPATIKAKYESNINTNAFDDLEKNKLGSIENGAQVNVGEEFTTAKSDKLDGIEDGAQRNIVARFDSPSAEEIQTSAENGVRIFYISSSSQPQEGTATLPEGSYTFVECNGTEDVTWGISLKLLSPSGFRGCIIFKGLWIFGNVDIDMDNPEKLQIEAVGGTLTTNAYRTIIETLRGDFNITTTGSWGCQYRTKGHVVTEDGTVLTEEYIEEYRQGDWLRPDYNIKNVIAGDNVTVTHPDENSVIVNASDPTTAGTLTTVFLTGDEVTTSEGTYYVSSTTKGTIATAEQSLSLNDNETKWFTQDVLGGVTVTGGELVSGNYSGQLSIEVDSDNGDQEYFIEFYKTDINGVLIDSGLTVEPIGDLGVRPFARGTTGIFDVPKNSPTNVPYTAILSENFTLLPDERTLYHIGAKKVGTTGGAVTFKLRYGTNWNSYLNTPIAITLQSVMEAGATSNVKMILNSGLDAKAVTTEILLINSVLTHAYELSEKGKLALIEDEANKYVLPSDVVQDVNYVPTDNNFTDAKSDKLDTIEPNAKDDQDLSGLLPLQGGNMSGNIGRSTHSSGFLVGGRGNLGSNDQKTSPIYTIGSSYCPSDSALGNMYGIGFTNSSSPFTPSSSFGWGLYVASQGVARVFLSGSSNGVSVFSANVYIKGTLTVGATLNMSSNKITNVADGTDSSDGVNKGQLDSKFVSHTIDLSGVTEAGVGTLSLPTGTGTRGQSVIVTLSQEISDHGTVVTRAHVRNDGSVGMYIDHGSSYTYPTNSHVFVRLIG